MTLFDYTKTKKYRDYKSCIELTDIMKKMVNNPIYSDKFIGSLFNEKTYHTGCQELKYFIDENNRINNIIDIKISTNNCNFIQVSEDGVKPLQYILMRI